MAPGSRLDDAPTEALNVHRRRRQPELTPPATANTARRYSHIAHPDGRISPDARVFQYW
jgi:hypothetical protein